MKKQHQSRTYWVGEVNEKLGYKLLLKATKILYDKESRYSRIIVAETENLGKILILGEKENLTLQFSENFPIYDEMLANIPMNSHPNPKKVLIIGGGDGAVLQNVLRYESVESVVLVEIDEEVVKVSKKFFKHSKVFSDPRVEIVHMDGAQYLENTRKKFDVIIGDYTDPYEGTPAETLINLNFYKNASKRLNDYGIISVQAGSPIYQSDILRDIYLKMKKIFITTRIYLSPSPIYPGGMWAYCISSNQKTEFKPFKEITGTMYYNKQIHLSSFNLPSFIEEIVK